MKFSSSSTAMFASLALGVARNVAAFGVRPAAHSMTTQRAFTSSAKSLNMANVLKLSDPQSQLLDEVDVFIFDCDGVIWRVREQLECVPCVDEDINRCANDIWSSSGLAAVCRSTLSVSKCLTSDFLCLILIILFPTSH